MTNQLTRHVAARFARTFAAVLGILCVLVTTLKLIEATRTLVHHEAPFVLGASLALCIALDFCHRLFFVALLLAAALCTSRMARSGELLGLWAQGLSPARLAQPFMLVACVLTACVMLSSDKLLPWAMAQRTALLQQHLGKVEPATLYFQKRSAWYFEGDRIYHLPRVLPDGTGFGNVSVYVLDGDSLSAVWRGDSLSWSVTMGWQLHQAVCYPLGEPTVVSQMMVPMPLTIAPKALTAHMGNPRELSVRAARALIARRRSSGLDTTVHSLETLERLAQPLCAPCLLGAALPWLLGQDRRRPLAWALCGTVALIAVVLAAGQVMRLLSLAHHLPVPLGASGQLVCAVLLACFQVARRPLPNWGVKPGPSGPGYKPHER